jgi:hypothetical protein
MNNSDSKIVQDGAQRLREAKNFFAMRRRLMVEVSRRYEAEMKNTSFWERLWLRVRIHREVSAELKKEFPSAALHIATVSPTSLIDGKQAGLDLGK